MGGSVLIINLLRGNSVRCSAAEWRPEGAYRAKKGTFFHRFQGISSVFHVVFIDYENSDLSDFFRFLGSFLSFLAFSRPVFPFFVLPNKWPVKMDFCLGEKFFSRREKNLCRKKKLFSLEHNSTLFLFRDSAKLKHVWLCLRCSIGSSYCAQRFMRRAALSPRRLKAHACPTECPAAERFFSR